MFSPSPITTANPAIAGKQQIARIARRIIARNYGLIDQILNIVVESNGLIKVWFQDDNLERSVILMTIGDTVEYRDVTNRRTDSMGKAVDWYIVSFANNIQLREDAIRKPKNCKKGTPCKGECIPKGSICRDIPVAKDEAIAINEAVIKSAPPKVTAEPANEDPYRDLNIRQLKEVAREKGVMRYSYMTQDQLRDAIRVYDANPDYRENIRKGLQRQKDEATLKKVKTTEIGRALSTVDPKLGRQYNLINAIAKKNEKNPAEARIYALATILSTSALIAKTMEKRRADNLNEAKVMATANASDIRESTPDVKEPSVTFVVGSYGKGSNALANALKNSKNISDDDKAWLENDTKLIPFKRSKEGVPSATDPIRAFAENFTTGYKAAIGNAIDNGKGDEAIALASQLYVHGSKYSLDRDGLLSSPALNVLAGEDGGTVARDAIEILRKMPKSPDSNGIRGTDIADRVRLVTLGTPYFGLAKPDVPEANIMGSDDLWNLTPFTKGGNETRKVSGVGSSGQSSYVESSDAMNIAFKHLRTVQEDRRKINPESIKARDAAIKEQENLAKSESERTEQERQRIAREQKKAADLKVLADRVRVEIEPLAKQAKKTIAQFIADNKGLVDDITAKEKEKIAKERSKARIGDEVAKAINTDSAIYLLARSDAYKKLKCKAGYVQRGAACQKEVQSSTASSKSNTKNNATGNLLKFGLPIASVAAIALAGKTVADDVKKVAVKIEPDDVFLKAGEPVPKEVLDMYEKEFKPGDLIKRKSLLNGLYIEHYGVYAGNGKIIETYAEEKFGGSTLLKGNIGRPSESDGTRYVKVEDSSGKVKPPSREQALKLAESMVGVPIKFDGVETNCEAIARLITQGEARTSQGEQLSWLTKTVGKFAASTFGGKNLDKGFTASEVQDLLVKNNYDPTLVKAVFADSVARRKQDIEKANRGDSMEMTALRSPDEFAAIVNKTIAPLNGASKTIVEQQMYKTYLVATIALVSKKPKGNANK